ncbi:MAG: DUF86 domain-containing protein [Actinomycetota bacterium]
MSRDDAWALDIVNAARLALEFVGDMSKDAFLSDRKTQAAVTRQIEIIGEAAKRLSTGFLAAHPDIALREAARMRDLVIHRYSNVDPIRLWGVVETGLDELITKLLPLLPTEPD